MATYTPPNPIQPGLFVGSQNQTNLMDPNSLATSLLWNTYQKNTQTAPSVATTVTPTVSTTGVNFGAPSSYSNDLLNWADKNGINPITGEPLKQRSWGELNGLEKLTTGVSIASDLANIWGGIQQNRLARDSFNMTKGVAETNLANQIQSYNTALSDRANARYSAASRDQAAIDKYIQDNKAVSKL